MEESGYCTLITIMDSDAENEMVNNEIEYITMLMEVLE